MVKTRKNRQGSHPKSLNRINLDKTYYKNDQKLFLTVRRAMTH